MATSLVAMTAVNEPKEDTQTPAANENIGGFYGRGLQITVTRPETERQVITVTASFGIDCGTDSMLLMYERRAGIWRQSLRWQSADYNEISGAFGDFFQVAVLPQGQQGQWLAAVAHGTPWSTWRARPGGSSPGCTSRWSGFALDLIQPARDGAPQRVLQNMKHGYVRENEPVIKYRADGF
jgi:hypothetical protein